MEKLPRVMVMFYKGKPISVHDDDFLIPADTDYSCCEYVNHFEFFDMEVAKKKAESDKAVLQADVERLKNGLNTLLDAATGFDWDAIMFSRENAMVIKDRHIRQMIEAIDSTDKLLAAFLSPEVKKDG